jgi:hypothetical protein
MSDVAHESQDADNTLPAAAQAIVDKAAEDVDAQVRDMLYNALVHRATRETSREAASRMEDLAIRLRARPSNK